MEPGKKLPENWPKSCARAYNFAFAVVTVLSTVDLLVFFHDLFICFKLGLPSFQGPLVLAGMLKEHGNDEIFRRNSCG